MIDLPHSAEGAREIATLASGRDPGPMANAESASHHVYTSEDVVVKIVDAGSHSRLDREIAIAPHLPRSAKQPPRSRPLRRAHSLRRQVAYGRCTSSRTR